MNRHNIRNYVIRTGFLALAMLAAGCEGQIENWDEVNGVPELKVHAVDYTHAVHFDPSNNLPHSLEMDQLSQFMSRIRTRRDDPIEVRYENTPARRDQAAIMKAILEDQGFQVRAKRIEPVDGGTQGSEPIVVAVTKAVIKLPDCPNWNDDVLNGYSNLTYQNFGCANVTNLGLMIDRPMDLVRGRSDGVFDGDLAASSIQRYRTRETTPLNIDDFGLVSESSSSSQTGE